MIKSSFTLHYTNKSPTANLFWICAECLLLISLKSTQNQLIRVDRTCVFNNDELSETGCQRISISCRVLVFSKTKILTSFVQ